MAPEKENRLPSFKQLQEDKAKEIAAEGDDWAQMWKSHIERELGSGGDINPEVSNTFGIPPSTPSNRNRRTYYI